MTNVPTSDVKKKVTAAMPSPAIKPPVGEIPPQQEEGNDDETRFQPISAALTWRLLSWLKPYKKLYMLGALSGATAILLELATPWLTKQIIDTAIPSNDVSQVIYWAAIWFGVSFLALVMDGIQISATNRCGERVIVDLRMAVFSQLQKLSMSFYDKTRLGRIITRGTSDMDALRQPVISGVNTVAFNGLMMVGAAIMILYTDWRLFLSVCWLAPVLTLCNHIYRQKIGEQWQLTREGYSKVASNLAENITGVRVVSAFNRQDQNLERFNALQEENTANNVRASHLNGIYQPFLEFIKFIGQVIILAYGGALALRGQLQAGAVIAVFLYWDKFMNPTINMGNFYNTLMQAMASCERIFDLLDMEPDVKDKLDAKELPRLDGHIEFDHVTFGYDPARPVLHDICLDVPAGKTFALVGATGSGKSSTVSLLARFYEFQSGSIRVDGHDIRDAKAASLHKQMGLVLQVNYLFSGTILDNIRYPRPEATDEEVYAAAKALNIHDTLAGLAEGYQTLVGERGASISLGLRQLICFTRVLLANPSIFLLDEATSSIDTVTEMKVQSALERLVKGRTTLIVAHRLSTIVKADCIIVLEQGRIIERGTHAQLLEARGQYALMYDRFVAHQVAVPGVLKEVKAEGPVIK